MAFCNERSIEKPNKYNFNTFILLTGFRYLMTISYTDVIGLKKWIRRQTKY